MSASTIDPVMRTSTPSQFPNIWSEIWIGARYDGSAAIATLVEPRGALVAKPVPEYSCELVAQDADCVFNRSATGGSCRPIFIGHHWRRSSDLDAVMARGAKQSRAVYAYARLPHRLRLLAMTRLIISR
ncbi:MAG: hypothetical protein JNL35_05905 [Sphingopyxis sp.]|nr:hypothetical protein [Sphingopyxis sp.]